MILRISKILKTECFGFCIIFVLFLLFPISVFSQTDTTASEIPKRKDFKLSDYLKIHGFIDAQFGYDSQMENDGSHTRNSVFMLRRARFDFSGNIIPMIDFRLQADMAIKPRLLDTWVRFKFCKYANLQVGQIKTPLTMDNFYSPIDLEFMELSQVVAALAGFNDISGITDYSSGIEIGAMLSGILIDFEKGDERIPILKYYAGIFGGSGINITKDNLSKDFSARIDFYPFVKELRFSGSFYYGNYNLKNKIKAPRTRYSGGFEYMGKNWTSRAEYLYGETGIENQDPSLPDSMYIVKTHGFYAFVGYWFHGRWGKDKGIETKVRPLFRYDYYVRDLRDYSTNSNWYSFGLEWWPEKHVRLHLDYTLIQRKTHHELGHSLALKVSVKY